MLTIAPPADPRTDTDAPKPLRSHLDALRDAFHRLGFAAGSCYHPFWALEFRADPKGNYYFCQICFKHFPTHDTPSVFGIEEDPETAAYAAILAEANLGPLH